MNVIHKILIVLLTAGTLGSCQSPAREGPEEGRPFNILWLVAEDMSPDLGCNGNTLVRTPAIDSLAAEGMLFTNVFATAPVCAPSRTALATGMYQTTIGAYHMRYPDSLLPSLPRGVMTFPQLFRQNGYVTANIKDAPGKGKTDWMFRADLDEHFDFNHWNQLATVEKPFFAQVSVKHTHRVFEKAQEGQFPLDKLTVPPYLPDHPVTRRDIADYYASIEALDRDVRQVLDSLAHYGLEKNTVIVFFSDHGWPITRSKTFHYDSGLKVPLIIRFPAGAELPGGFVAGSTSERLLSTIDITATTLALAGITLPREMQGEVFLGPETGPEREMVFSATNRIGEVDFRSRSLRSHRYRYTRNYHRDFSVNSATSANTRSVYPTYHLLNILHERGELTPVQENLLKPMPYEELYDLRDDPFEVRNLAGDPAYSDVLEEMSKAMDRWLKETDDQGLDADPPEIVAAFAAYGEQSHKKHEQKIAKLHREVEIAINENK